LTRSAAVLGGTTLISRILGFLRDILIASAFGTGIAAQAFVIAFMIPNLLRDLVAEGAVNTSIVPILVSYLKKGKEAFWELVAHLLNHALLILGALSFLGILFAPTLVSWVAPGFLKYPEQYALTVDLTRILFPFIFLMGLSAYAMGVLNTLKHFFIPSLGSSFLNLSMILSLFFLVPIMNPPILGLAVGVLVGGVIQCVLQYPVLRKSGFVYRFVLNFKHPGVQQVSRLVFPRLIGSAVYQLSVIVDRIFASLAHIVGEGGVAALYYSNRIVQLPFALFGVSLATAALPTLSEEAHEEGLEAFQKTLLFSLKSVFFVMVPAVIGVLILNRPIVVLLFERGSFDRHSTDITTQALFFYVMGLLAFSGSKILSSAFYSLQDTRTPVKAGMVSLIVNVFFNALLMYPMKIGGIALATTISSTIHFFILSFLLRRRIGSFGEKTLFQAFLKYCLAGALMGGVLFLGVLFLLNEESRYWPFHCLLIIFLGGLSYFGFAKMLRIEETGQLIQCIFKRE